MNELFERVAGFSADDTDLVMLKMYVGIGDERDTLELIEDMSSRYEDPEGATTGFTVVWHWLVRG